MATRKTIYPTRYFSKHQVDASKDAEIKWLWGLVKTEVFDQYPDIEKIELDFGIAYDDSFYEWRDSLRIDDYFLDNDQELIDIGEIAIIPQHQRDALEYFVDHEEASSMYEKATADIWPTYSDTPAGAIERAAWTGRFLAWRKQAFIAYLAPLQHTSELILALLLDLEEEYFTSLFGLHAHLTFTRRELTIGQSQELNHPAPDDFSLEHDFWRRIRER